MNNLYFPVYKQIETEVIGLASSIYFADDQLSVYSLKIAELILRCAVEIESLVKDIYRNNIKEEPEKPGACLKWMDDNWKISNKEVFIVSPVFHIDSFRVIKPFDYKDKSPEDFYSSYCAIKHDREKNLSKANLNTLIRSLAALYILNIYFLGERFYLGEDQHASKLDKSAGSQVFVFSVAPSPYNTLYTSEEKIVPETCIYKITRKESEYAFNITFKTTYNEIKTLNVFRIGKEYQEKLLALSGQPIDEHVFWNYLASNSKENEIQVKDNFIATNKICKILSITIKQMEAAFWAELNI